jgi:hypothetical protein
MNAARRLAGIFAADVDGYSRLIWATTRRFPSPAAVSKRISLN